MWSKDDRAIGDNRGEMDAEIETNSDLAMVTDNNQTSSNAGQQNAVVGGRERSFSVPCGSDDTNLETVVTKAKKASSYLWMLLHSQNCRLANRCTYSGCADAKLVHLHLKTCPAGHDFPCPTRYNGCLQARKLLAHYKRCRNIRARQLSQSQTLKGQHVCLICSMVARQARSLLDSNSSSRPQGPVVVHKKKGNTNAGKCHMVSSFSVKAKIHPGILPVDTLAGKMTSQSFSPLSSSQDNSRDPSLMKNDFSDGGVWEMPPPAPRSPPLPKSAPASPRGDKTRMSLGGIGSMTSRSGAPLLRKRSESLGSEIMMSNGRRAVTFAARPEVLELEQRSLVEVELDSGGLDPANDGSEGDHSPTRARSASCHVFSSSNSSSSPPGSCSTIQEEVGPSSSCMDE